MTAPGRFEARLFAPGLPPAGEPVSAWISGDSLHVEGGARLALPLDGVSAAVGGFDHDTVFLHFSLAGTRHSLQVVGTASLAALQAQAPPALLAGLSKVGAGVRRQRWIWRTIFCSGAALGLCIGLLVWRYDHAVAWAAERMSPETERRLGQQVVASLREDGRLLEAGPTVQAVADLGNRLTAGSRYDYRWFVLIDKDVNAFAAPGGVVVVHSGLIEAAQSAEELAGVLAHEVQHVELRHSVQNMIHAMGWAALLTVVLGDVNAIAGVLIHQAGTMRFSRELESQADLHGLQALRRADLPTEGMVTFFRRLQKEEKGSVPFLSSHPATAERIERLESAIKALPHEQAKPSTIDWAAIKNGLAKESPIDVEDGSDDGND